ncbi:hypothetical protein Tco_0533038 [Tanacetum coccineum]
MISMKLRLVFPPWWGVTDSYELSKFSFYLSLADYPGDTVNDIIPDEEKYDDNDNDNDDNNDHSLIRKRKTGSSEVRNEETPIPTPSSPPRIELSSDKAHDVTLLKWIATEYETEGGIS